MFVQNLRCINTHGLVLAALGNIPEFTDTIEHEYITSVMLNQEKILKIAVAVSCIEANSALLSQKSMLSEGHVYQISHRNVRPWNSLGWVKY